MMIPNPHERRGNRVEKELSIRLNFEALDDAIEKTNRLVELLREVQQIVGSLSNSEINYEFQEIQKKLQSRLSEICKEQEY